MNMKWKCMRLSEGGGRRGTWVSELMFKHSCFPLRKNNFPISGNKGGPTSQLLNTRPGILFWFPAPEMDLRLCCQNMMKGEIASIHIFLVGFHKSCIYGWRREVDKFLSDEYIEWILSGTEEWVRFCHQLLRWRAPFKGDEILVFVRTKGLKLPRISTSLSPKCSLQMKGYSGCFWKLNDELMIVGWRKRFISRWFYQN